MKKILSLFAFILIFSQAVNAVVVQKVRLKNGSVLNGYVEKQEADGSMVVRTDNAIICLTEDRVQLNDRSVEEADLTEEWKKWAEKNDAYDLSGDSKHLLLSDVTTGSFADSVAYASQKLTFEERIKDYGRVFHGVRVLESGATIKFLQLTPDSYHVTWDDIIAIESEKRPKNALSGINRKYYLNNGREVSGQYAGETATTLSLYQENGRIETVNFKDVKKYTYYGINPSQDIFAQSELLDVVQRKGNVSLRGIIIEQNYSESKDSENYISIWEQGKSPQMVKISEIEAICKEANSAYAPKFDILLKEGEVMVNRIPVEFVKIKENGDNLLLDSLSNKITLRKIADKPTIICVEYRIGTSPNVEQFQLVKVRKSKPKKKNGVVYGFSYKDLVNSSYQARSIETSSNFTTKVEYEVSGTGIFALYDAQNKRAIPVTVKYE